MKIIEANLFQYLKNEEGSAVVEFVALGLPLFLPLFIFLSSVVQISSDQSIVQNLARQSARAFVTAPNDSLATQRLEMMKQVFQSKYFAGSSRNISLNVSCESSPCITLDSKVQVSASLTSSNGSKTYYSTATELVDRWRNSN
jgi:Flp pilus assembly protein TadG